MTKQWILVLLAAAVVSAPAVAQQRASARNNDANAYKRLDHAELVELLQSLGMKEYIAALADQTEGSKDLADMFVSAQCKANLALGEVANLARREALMNEAVELTRRCVELSSSSIKAEPDYVTAFQHRVALARVLGYDRCALYGDKVLMLIGGDEDRKLLERYTRDVLVHGKDADGFETRAMIDTLLDDMSMKLEDWQNEAWFMTLSPAAEKYHATLRELRAWMLFYRGLGVSDPQTKDDCMDQAILAAEPFLENEDGEPDAGIMMLQAVANSELGYLKKHSAKPAEVRESQEHFTQAQELLQAAQKVKGIPDPLKINLEFHLCCNLIRWGKYSDALAKINEMPKYMTGLLGNDAALAADMRVALLLNYLYDSQAAATKDAKEVKAFTEQGQQAIMAFINKHAADTEAVGDFLKMLASKFRGVDVKDLKPLLQYAVGCDYFDQYAELLNAKGNQARMEEARKKAAEAMSLVIANSETPADIKSKAQSLSIALGGNWQDVAAMALAFKGTANDTKEALYNAAIALKNALDKGQADDEEGDSSAAQLTLVEIINKLSTNEGFKADPKSQELYYDLGEMYRSQAKRNEADANHATKEDDRAKFVKLMIDNLAAGADAYAKVPPNNPRLALGARFMSINLRYDRLRTLKETAKDDPTLGGLANEMLALIDAFIKDASDARKNSKDDALAKDLPSWISLAQFYQGVLTWEFRENDNGKLRGEAMFDAIRKEYPNTPVVLLCWEYQIRRAIEANSTAEAIRGIGELQKQSAEQATALMDQVIQRVKDDIDKLRDRNTAEDQQKLTNLRKTYKEFAEQLLKSAPADSSRLRYEQLYADALLKSGDAAGAMTRFQTLRDAEEKEREKLAAPIDKLINDKLAELKSKTINEPVKQLGKEFPDFVAKQNLPAGEFYEREVTVAVDRVDKAATPDDVKFAYDNLKLKLQNGYEKTRELLKNRIPVNMANLQGLARCYHAQQNFVEALKLYELLTSNLSREDYPTVYWRMELEKMQCQYDQAMTLSGDDRARAIRFVSQWVDRHTNGMNVDTTRMADTQKEKYRELESEFRDLESQFRNLKRKIEDARRS